MIEWNAKGITRAQADGRYVKRFVGNVLTADTLLLNGRNTFVNPNGPILAQIPLDASPLMLPVSAGLGVELSLEIIRAGAGGSAAPSLIGYQARGTLQAPTASQLNDRLFVITSGGFDGTQRRSSGQTFYRATENWTPTALGCEYVLTVVRAGTQSVATAFTVRSDAPAVTDIIYGQATTRLRPSITAQLRNPSDTATLIEWNATGLGFFGTAPIAKPTVTGAKGGNAALSSLLAQLAALGLITDSTT